MNRSFCSFIDLRRNACGRSEAHRTGSRGKMNWFAQHRQDWIEETLEVFGFINREHLMRKFGVSVPQASMDLQKFQRMNPDAMTYNLTTKRYEATKVTEQTTKLALIAIMNALDVHMPPDGKALRDELREIAATVGYPWQPTSPPPLNQPLVTRLLASNAQPDETPQGDLQRRFEAIKEQAASPMDYWNWMQDAAAEMSRLREALEAQRRIYVRDNRQLREETMRQTARAEAAEAEKESAIRQFQAAERDAQAMQERLSDLGQENLTLRAELEQAKETR